jgi:2-oxoisovalerate dehydrogenase E2 component (dihydrolipoyl transacylase)
MGEFVIKLPDVGEGIAEAEIVEWNVAVGDLVNEDDPLVSVMTDKATVELPSPVTGKVLWQGAAVGEVLAIGAELVRIEVEGEGNVTVVEAVASPPPAESEPAPAGKPEAAAAASPPGGQPVQTVSPAPRPAAALPRPAGEKPLAAPSVRGRARDMGVDLRYVHGSGPAGRITHEDLDDFTARGGASASRGLSADHTVEEIRVIGLRRRIAQKMQDAKRRIPHFSYVEEVDVTELEALRGQLNSQRRADQVHLTLLPFLVRALVGAVRQHPAMNARFDDEADIIYRYGGVHVGIAAQTPQGLMVPVLRHAESRDLWECAAEIQRLAEVARTGRAKAEELKGSTISISSLGPLGGIVSTPVINAPEVAIIGVNKIGLRPVFEQGTWLPRKIMNLSSSFDHRVVDGVNAAEFIQRLKNLLEHPALLTMDPQ